MADHVDSSDLEIIQEKTCVRCGATKPAIAFIRDSRRPSGFASHCKACEAEKCKKQYLANPSAAIERAAAWRKLNPKRRAAHDAKRRAEKHDQVREIARKSYAKTRAEDPELARAIGRKKAEKRRATARGRLEASIKSGVYQSLKGNKQGRKTYEILGYSLEDLVEHLESKFLPGMTWDNYGKWHVDHKVPLAAHNYTSPDDIDFKRAWALSNLQPLWAVDNMKKSDKLIAPFQPSLAI